MAVIDPLDSGCLVREAREVRGHYADTWLDTPTAIDPQDARNPEVTRRRLIESDSEEKRQLVKNELDAIRYGHFS